MECISNELSKVFKLYVGPPVLLLFPKYNVPAEGQGYMHCCRCHHSVHEL